MSLFVTKIEVVEAIQFTEETKVEVNEFIEEPTKLGMNLNHDLTLTILGEEEDVVVNIYDWVVLNKDGSYLVFDDESFNMIYKPHTLDEYDEVVNKERYVYRIVNNEIVKSRGVLDTKDKNQFKSFRDAKHNLVSRYMVKATELEKELKRLSRLNESEVNEVEG